MKIALNKISSFQELNNSIKISKVRLSFFGSRLVEIEGFKKPVRLDTLASKWFRLDNPNTTYSKGECEAALNLKKKIESSYQESDELIKKSKNIFVVFLKIISSVISFFLKPLGIPFTSMFNSRIQNEFQSIDAKIYSDIVHQSHHSYGLR